MSAASVTSDASDDPQAAPSAAAHQVYDALRRAGVDFAVYLPDSVLFGVTDLLERDGAIQTIVCAREDEGVAIAVGAYLAGKLPVALMEGSGLGYCGLILARALLQRTPLLLLVSHNLALGEPHDYHGATRLTGEGLARGIGIPYFVIHDAHMIKTAVSGAVQTVRGQKTPVCLFVPGSVMHGRPE
jgi:sulfopyruvate decarboxylase TPP-binding subunit